MSNDNNKNPGHNSILQALLDLKDGGHGDLTVDTLIQKISTDRKLADNLQAKWDAHHYPERSITFTRMTIADQYMLLSDTALRVLILMGLRSHQSGLIQISRADLCALTGLKETAIKSAIKTLTEHGCIAVKVPAIRHTPPIYEVNKKLFAQGKPTLQNFDYSACKDSFLLTKTVEHKTAVATVHTKAVQPPDGIEKTIVYNRVTVAQKEKELPSALTPDSSNKKISSSTPIISAPLKAVNTDFDSDISADLDDTRLPFNHHMKENNYDKKSRYDSI